MTIKPLVLWHKGVAWVLSDGLLRCMVVCLTTRLTDVSDWLGGDIPLLVSPGESCVFMQK